MNGVVCHPRDFRCLNTLFLLSTYSYFIVIYLLPVKNLWMSLRASTQTKQVIVYHNGRWGQGLGAHTVDLNPLPFHPPPPPPHPPPPPPNSK